MEVIVAGTGHRPVKLTTRGQRVAYSEELYRRLVALATAELTALGATKVISGMALGWDQALAEAAIRMGLPVVAAVPFRGQEATWPEASQTRYRHLLHQCSEVVIVSEGGFSGRAMQARNVWMVDRCTVLLALWDGSDGGTGNCIAYLQRKVAMGGEVTLHNCWKRWTTRSGLY